MPTAVYINKNKIVGYNLATFHFLILIIIYYYYQVIILITLRSLHLSDKDFDGLMPDGRCWNEVAG